MIASKIVVGSPAPEFNLPDQNGNFVSLSDFVGKKPIVLFFYPKDDSAGCTLEACAFRDSYTAFQDAGAEVIGISADSETSHQKFANKHRLPYILLSDRQRQMRKLYEVPNTLGIFDGRVTFVIDKEGIIRHIFNSQTNPFAHIPEALKVLATLA